MSRRRERNFEETKLVASYFDHIALETRESSSVSVFKDTMTALEMSAVEKLIVWENLDMERLESS